MSLLEVRNADVRYGEIQVLYSLDLEVEKGSITSIIGPNGCGKSTLLKTILGLLRPSRGSITFDGEKIDELPPYKIVEKGVTYVPEGRRIFPNLTVFENLLIGAYTKSARKYVDENLEKVFQIFPILRERKSQRAGTLSGGEMQMLAIARGLMGMPRLLMVDEPSQGVMPIMVMKIFDTIKQISEQNITVLLTDQNVAEVLKLSHKAYVMESGRIILRGEGQMLLLHELIRKAYLGI
jgi:branched-chain amino acid transport system ATP-binding protein